MIMDISFTPLASVFLIVIVFTLLMAFLIAVYVLFYQKKLIQRQKSQRQIESAYRQQMLSAEVEAQEGERRRVAEDLRNAVGSMLAAIKGDISMLSRNIPGSKGIGQTLQMVDDTIHLVRQISYDLTPASLEMGLSHALKKLFEKFYTAYKVPIELREQNIFKLDQDKELIMFRMVQDLVYTSIRDAQPSKILVTLSETRVMVEHDGLSSNIGMIKNGKQRHKENAWAKLENLARLLGGTLEYYKTRENGTMAMLTLILSPHETESYGYLE